ncbi:LppU/SCO3897 family protein [Nocardia panacis]|nr:hypothetical protein [Nocardia panacis]
MTTPPNLPNSGQPQQGWGAAPPAGGPYATPPGGAPYPPPNYGAPQGDPMAGPQTYPAGGFPPPGQPGFPPAAPVYVPSPPQRKANLLRALLVVAGVLAVVIGLGAVVHYLTRSDPQKIEVGQCAKLGGSSYKPEFAIKSCEDAEANYVVAQRIDKSNADCATKDYASYYEVGRKTSSYTLCLRLNVKEGDCVKTSHFSASSKVACTASADFKIGRIVTGRAEPAACGSGATEHETIVYPKPDPMTLCLVAPK